MVLSTGQSGPSAVESHRQAGREKSRSANSAAQRKPQLFARSASHHAVEVGFGSSAQTRMGLRVAGCLRWVYRRKFPAELEEGVGGQHY